MVGIYEQVMMAGAPNFIRAKVPVSSNLNLAKWRDVATTQDQHTVVDFLTYGFQAAFEGEVPSHSFYNHPSAWDQTRHVASYIATEIGHGALLGPFDYLLFFPWCSIIPLLTQPTKDSNNHQVILNHSWPLPPTS